MPPKGWRKNADGQYPQPNKDAELVSIDDILFPRSSVQKLAKNIIAGDEGSNMILAKDSMTALQRSATVFVSYILFHARQLSKEGTRKTISTQDIIHALERAEFAGFIPEVKHKLSAYESNVALKKKVKSDTKAAAVVSNSEDKSDDFPQTKKLKTNSESAVGSQVKTNDDDDEEDEEEEVEDEEMDDDEVEKDDEPENTHNDSLDVEEVDVNPIAALSKEEAELGGTEQEDEDQDDEGRDNSSDDGEN